MPEKAWVLILFGIIYLIAGLSAGFRLDEQVGYPFEGRHIVKLSKRAKNFFVFQNKRGRRYFFRAAVIQQLFGYFQLLLFIGVSFTPNIEAGLILFMVIGCLETTYVLGVVLYYKILKKIKQR